MSFVISTVDDVLDSLSERQVCRYMGLAESSADAALRGLMDTVKPRFLNEVRCKACYTAVPVRLDGSYVDLTVLSVNSAHLARNLRGCEYAVLFAATLGMGTERQRRRAAAVSPTEALILDAMGSAGIEQFCDQISLRFAQAYPAYKLRPRFSPGYGDFSLDIQDKLLNILDAQRKIGVSVTDGFLMIPQKSVTAVVGLSKNGCNKSVPDCDYCEIAGCEFRL